ncbi:CoA-transferase family III [Agrocybe pediades]|nr:CoA-transferase family III [Agrocybe pediades]
MILYTSATDVAAALKIWTSYGLPEKFLRHLKFTGNPDTVVPSSFRLGLAAQISTGLAGLSAAYLHYLRTGVEQDVVVDARHAALSFHSEAWYTINDKIPSGDTWDSIAGLYRTKDDSWVRIHTNFPHHRTGVLRILGISDVPAPALRTEVAKAIKEWDSKALEDESAKSGMCVFKLRTREEWESTPQDKALHNTPVVEIKKVGEAERTKLRDTVNQARPLTGVKILDLSRVLAGPIAGRTLAAHGAQVLLVTSPNLPALPGIDVETSLGKHTTQLDLDSAKDREKFDGLVQHADVFLQAYRPGGLASRGFGVEDIIKRRKNGMVYASLRAWGWEGPWADRRGFDSLVQTATGFNADEPDAFMSFQTSQGKSVDWAPKPFPMQAIDHTSAYFLAFGINVALGKMITDGGSHEVRVSLAGVGNWIRSLGRIDATLAFGSEVKQFPKTRADEEIVSLSTTWLERRGKDGGEGRKMTALRHAAVLAATPVREGSLNGSDEDDWGAPMRLDADEPVWV